MKKMPIIIFVFVLCFFSVSCIQTKTISFPFKLTEVKTVEIFHFIVPADAEKKVITKQEDIMSIYRSLENISLKDEVTEPAAGGSTTSFRFNLSDGTSYEIFCSETSGLSEKIYFSNSDRNYSTTADIEKIWYNYDYKVEQIPENELPVLY